MKFQKEMWLSGHISFFIKERKPEVMESFITTYTGKHVNPFKLDLQDIDIRDIAHALSLTCRGNGHVKHFFSVGQHCINCALEAKARGYSDRIILGALLHDASECYISDIPSPLKDSFPEIKRAEDKILDTVMVRFLGTGLLEQEKRMIKIIDRAMLKADLYYLLGDGKPVFAGEYKRKLDYRERPPEDVEKEYLSLFRTYKAKHES